MIRDQYKAFNCYEILGIPPTSSPSEIKSAWKRASFIHHPDKGGSNGAQAKVNHAYEVLSDPVSRQAHDIYWKRSFKSTTQKPTPPNWSGQPLSSLKERLFATIQGKKSAIWADLPNRTKAKEDAFISELNRARKNVYWTAAMSGASALLGSYSHLFWFACVGFAGFAISKCMKTNIGGRTFRLFVRDAASKIYEHANAVASQSCKSEAERLDTYNSSFASLVELLNRPSSFDDSEEQVARRITACLFLMGYTPEFFDRGDRILGFKAGDESILVRFRHRDGAATNIKYVEKLAFLMHAHGASHGLVFCSPGLSGNAAAFAHNNGIRHYSLETMNNWIKESLVAHYDGPAGDICAHMDNLNSFLRNIAPQLRYSMRGRNARSPFRR